MPYLYFQPNKFEHLQILFFFQHLHFCRLTPRPWLWHLCEQCSELWTVHKCKKWHAPNSDTRTQTHNLMWCYQLCYQSTMMCSKLWQCRQHCRLTICIELFELTNSVSDDKIQITILILRRGALSMTVEHKDTLNDDGIIPQINFFGLWLDVVQSVDVLWNLQFLKFIFSVFVFLPILIQNTK